MLNIKFKHNKLIISILFFIFLINITSFTSGHIEEKYSIITTFDTTFYVGGNGPNNYTKIQEAINDSLDGDTIYVYDF